MIHFRHFDAKFLSHEDCPVDELDRPFYSFIYAKMKLMSNKEIVNVRFNLGQFWLPELCKHIDRNSDKVFTVEGSVNKSGMVNVNHLCYSSEKIVSEYGWMNDSY